MIEHDSPKRRNTLAYAYYPPAGTWKAENHQVEMALAYSL